MSKKNDPFIKTRKELFYVMGYAQTGSGTLTYPEDFDEVGVFETEKDAKAYCRFKNEELAKEHDIELTEEDEDAREDELRDALQAADAYAYEYSRLPVLKMK